MRVYRRDGVKNVSRYLSYKPPLVTVYDHMLLTEEAEQAGQRLGAENVGRMVVSTGERCCEAWYGSVAGSEMRRRQVWSPTRTRMHVLPLSRVGNMHGMLRRRAHNPAVECTAAENTLLCWQARCRVCSRIQQQGSVTACETGAIVNRRTSGWGEQ